MSAPPSSSAVTSSPVAALTNGGPPRNTKPVPRTMIDWSHSVGRYAPPAVDGPITSASCGMPAAAHQALGAIGVAAKRVDLVTERQERAAGVHEIDHRKAVLKRDLLGTDDLLGRERIPGAALQRAVVRR